LPKWTHFTSNLVVSQYGLLLVNNQNAMQIIISATKNSHSLILFLQMAQNCR